MVNYSMDYRAIQGETENRKREDKCGSWKFYNFLLYSAQGEGNNAEVEK